MGAAGVRTNQERLLIDPICVTEDNELLRLEMPTTSVSLPHLTQVAHRSFSMNTKTLSLCLIMLATSFHSAITHGSGINCNGTINSVWVDKQGKLMVSGDFRDDNEPLVLCGLKEPWQDHPLEICEAWFTMATAAHSAGNPVSIYYYDVYSGPTNCSELPTGEASLKPGYMWLK